MSRAGHATGRRRVRGWLHTLHCWLGLLLGGGFVLIGLTGSLLSFYPEIDAFLHPGRSAASAVLAPAPISRVIDALRAAEPQRDGAWRIEFPRASMGNYAVRYYRPIETVGRTFAPLLLSVDAETCEVTRRRFWREDFFTWIYDLHYSLLLGETGQILLAAMSLLLVSMLLSGLYLWWPTMGNWRGRLAIKPGAAWVRRVYDLHVKLGVYMLPVMVVVVLTGLVLLMPGWFTPVLERFSPRTPYFSEAPKTGPAALTGRVAFLVSAEQALDLARLQFPAGDVRWLETPSLAKPVWRVQMRQPGEPNHRFPRSQVWIDADTGVVLAIRDPRQNSASDTFMDWLHPLHGGEAFGAVGRALICLAGLWPLLAYWSGCLRWLHKRRARAPLVRAGKISRRSAG